MKPRARQPDQCPDPEFEIIDSAMTNMFLPAWSHEVMYSPWLPPSLAIEKMSGMRNPMLYQYVNHKMLCALTYFMRNPKNWSV
eukprot:5416356-Amphidinium_carterae.1